jgi:hypothetical protein
MFAESVSTREIGGLRQTRAPQVAGDAPLAGLAERQHGVVGRRQLLELGLGEDAVDGLSARGWTLARRSTSSKLVHRHLATLPDDEFTAHEGIPVTTVPRTIFDLAAV